LDGTRHVLAILILRKRGARRWISTLYAQNRNNHLEQNANAAAPSLNIGDETLE
jgi:hypothetical protein